MRRVGRIQSAERAKPTSITAGIQVTNLLSACDADTGDPMKGDFHDEAASRLAPISSSSKTKPNLFSRDIAKRSLRF